jgi:hypothetical protein
MIQLLSFSDGKLNRMLIPDHLRALLLKEGLAARESVTLVASYHALGPDVKPLGGIPPDSVSIYSIRHKEVDEFLIRLQRGSIRWFVYVRGADQLFEFDRRYIQSFIGSLGISSGEPGTGTLPFALLE